jgi:hypothetical protein
MATIQRPLKEGTVRTYQEKVGLGFTDILASEADADFDTIYAAWNGGVDSTTLKDGAVTTPKLVDLSVTTPKLAELAVTAAKIARGGTIYANNSASDATNLSIPGAMTFIKEVVVTVDTSGRLALMLARVAFNISRVAAGNVGAALNVQTYVGGTSGAVDGTLFSSETASSHALPVASENVMVWYPYFALSTPTASPLRWKICASNADPPNYAITKTTVGLLVVQLA